MQRQLYKIPLTYFMDCRKMPPATMAYLIIEICFSLACTIACIVESNSMFCYIQEYFDLCPDRCYKHFEFWRLITPYFLANSFWSVLFCTMYIVFMAFTFEKYIGTKRFIVVMLISMIANSLIASVIDAFFGLTPGIKSVKYFHDFWTHHSSLGLTAVENMLTVFMVRIMKLKSINFCCFKMPVWLGYILLLIFS